MDNTRDLPGYKYYVDPETGERPAVYVAYLDLAPGSDTAVNGIVFQARDLAAVDARERNYERRDVSGHVDPPAGGRVWAYFGTPAAKERFDRGRRSGSAVVNRGYLEGVREGFAKLGPDRLARFELTTDPPPVPVRELQRVELP